MTPNVGLTDRIVRIVLGMAIISLAFWGPACPWAWLGLIPLATGLFGRCGLYKLLGISTRK